MTVRSVVILSPEPPYPLRSGGAYRTASLVHYFARFADVDLILFSESGHAAELPAGLIRKQTVIPLPRHTKGALERWRRNGWRAIRGVPPLVDRLSGFQSKVRNALSHQHYDLGIAEHAWCAPYVLDLKAACTATLLDLHNVESVLHERSASVSGTLLAAGHRRFAVAMRKLEARLVPQFDWTAVTSAHDAACIKERAPEARTFVYPNALPDPERPVVKDQNEVAFSANFEYHPNIDAVAFLTREIWPEVQKRHPSLRLRLIGRGNHSVAHLVPPDNSVEMTGPVEDAQAEIARARIVVAPLRSGSGTRIKILEAWRAGRPVVATRIAAEGLQVTDGDNLLLAESPADFADAIDRLLRDSDLRRAISQAGRRTFAAFYTWEAAWRSLDQYYNQNSCNSPTFYTE